MRPAVYRTEPDRATAPPVVLVQGLAVSKYLRPAAHALAASGAACELLELPGFGRAENPPKPLDIPGFAAVVADYLRGRDEEVVLAGHSSGTQIAALAATAPGLPVSRVVLGSPTVDPGSRSIGRMFLNWVKDGRHESPVMTRVQVGEWLRAGPRRILTLTRSMLEHHLEDMAVPHPVTVVRGSLDPLCTDEWAASLGKLVTVHGRAHAFPYQDPHAFADAILGA
ncbi:Alpha/beta hydrolase family protein [Amycolatopsis xylanica]|uniref:Alpha/beta hydrolase family protein n=1 Tax=Amycolatopsis xylanica TaxID=589385 RepID=A0A1H3RH90_9PSEU|nr:alpha/beta hydrolase [Amycolatopsis xylanica]SDZ24953.1 Alpha/beta hydrolase family protein [Amycolatopsis xylanica]